MVEILAKGLLSVAESTGGNTQIINSMTTGFTSAVTDIMSAISSILPVVIPVAGAIAVVVVGYKVFKRFSKG